jgi:IrrE N-terminal-like domain
MLSDISPCDLAAAIDGVVADVLCEAGVESPPVDALAVARRLGCQVAWDDSQPGRARIVRSAASSTQMVTILLRPEPRRERRQWAIAHEVGEQAAARVFARLALDPRACSADARERVANHFAGRLLVPQPWFEQQGRACRWDLFALKATFATASHELLARRMLEAGPTIVITMWDQGYVTLRAASAGYRPPPPHDVELQCRAAAIATGLPAHVLCELGDARGWPIHEPDWRREIVRFELWDASE